MTWHPPLWENSGLIQPKGITVIDYPVFFGLWALVLVFVILNRSAKFNGPEQVLREEGDLVFCRDVPLSRIFKLKGKALLKAEVIKVKQAYRCVSLVSANGKEVELWLPKATVNAVSQKAQALFPNAEFVRVDG